MTEFFISTHFKHFNINFKNQRDLFLSFNVSRLQCDTDKNCRHLFHSANCLIKTCFERKKSLNHHHYVPKIYNLK